MGDGGCHDGHAPLLCQTMVVSCPSLRVSGHSSRTWATSKKAFASSAVPRVCCTAGCRAQGATVAGHTRKIRVVRTVQALALGPRASVEDDGDPLRLVRLSPLMETTRGRAEIAIGLIDGPVAIDHPDLTTQSISQLPGPAT